MCKDARKKYDWVAIQKFHDLGNSWREIQKEFGVWPAAIRNASQKGWFHPRSKAAALQTAWQRGKFPKQHTAATKKKISDSRIKFLVANPDKVPYRINHSSKKSYPETVFENALLAVGVTGWVYNYQHGIYSYDFAWPELKIDVEIDGGTHTLEKVKAIDARRDKFSTDHGWTVVRFTAAEVKKNVIACLKKLEKMGVLGLAPSSRD
jgi:very-short-patch-repair endonuclease